MKETFESISPKERRIVRKLQYYYYLNYKDTFQELKDKQSMSKEELNELWQYAVIFFKENELTKTDKNILKKIFFIAAFNEYPNEKTLPELYISDILKNFGPDYTPESIFKYVILNSDVMYEQIILDALDEICPGFDKKVIPELSNFDVLFVLEPFSLQKLLREIKTEDLSKALQNISDEKLSIIFSNMSKRSGQLLKEEMEMESNKNIQPMEITISRKKIIRKLKDLIKSGDII